MIIPLVPLDGGTGLQSRLQPNGATTVRGHHLQLPRPKPEPKQVVPVRAATPRNLEHRRSAAQREKILVRTFAVEGEVIELTDTLVRAIAHKLWELYGGDEKLNWLEAEMLLHDVLRRYHGLWDERLARDVASANGARSVRPASSTGTHPND